jgi:CheY-like chemotaxis protein
MADAAWVVVVDDDPEMRSLVAFHLEQAGYRVTTCGDGWNAVVQTQGLKTGLLISDIQMPGGKGGGDAVRALRDSPNVSKQLPVIFMSSLEPDQAAKLVPIDPYIRFVQKPIDWGKLQQAIKDLTGVDRKLG